VVSGQWSVYASNSKRFRVFGCRAVPFRDGVFRGRVAGVHLRRRGVERSAVFGVRDHDGLPGGLRVLGVEVFSHESHESMKVLVACEFSGIVRDAFAARGHDVWSCDLLPTERPGNHIQGDVLEVLNDGWDLMIGHPPCTYLSYVGNRHWDNPGRARKRLEGLSFFLEMWDAPIEKICLENPMGVIDRVITKHHQIIQPYYFGDSQMKTTCLWLKNLPKLFHAPTPTLFSPATHAPKPEPVYFLKTNGKAIHWTEAVKGGKKRSTFWPGIANAMATQWG
jgi:hypothetical protein